MLRVKQDKRKQLKFLHGKEIANIFSVLEK